MCLKYKTEHISCGGDRPVSTQTFLAYICMTFCIRFYKHFNISAYIQKAGMPAIIFLTF